MKQALTWKETRVHYLVPKCYFHVTLEFTTFISMTAEPLLFTKEKISALQEYSVFPKELKMQMSGVKIWRYRIYTELEKKNENPRPVVVTLTTYGKKLTILRGSRTNKTTHYVKEH
ncbi:unnamed protein product [Leptidea sinapis]|uniref:Uncharacterized protein n=1 Tax=Leptidea sinapis TaxID=189913 RepID=A0A5E4QRH2_9NEOP|nr:unnamed protein product [Leptidea sinapis]